MAEARKQCSRCKQEKYLTQFYRQTVAKDGRRAECKECRYPIDAEYSKKNSAKRVATAKAWRLQYPERHKEHQRNHYRRKSQAMKVEAQSWN